MKGLIAFFIILITQVLVWCLLNFWFRGGNLRILKVLKTETRMAWHHTKHQKYEDRGNIPREKGMTAQYIIS
jgi:hypothetical protein